MAPLTLSPADRRRLVGLCGTISGDPVAAEDLAQETLMEAWRNAHKLRDASGTEPWLNAIARNVCRRWAHRQAVDRRHLTEFGAVADVVDDLDVELDLERAELVELLGRALALLPEPTRRVLVARYLEERSHAEIAERLGVSPDAVMMRVSRGKVLLRRVLESELGPESELHVAIDATDPAVSTGIWCTECGRARLLMIRAAAGDTVAFRCPNCTPTPSGRTHAFDLTAPTFARLLGPVSRPTAILGRAAKWADEYFLRPSSEDGQPRVEQCVRCARPVVVRGYLRTDPEFAGAARLGRYAECPACQQEVSCSLSGMALAHPQARAYRRRHPRLRAVPMHHTSVASRAALVVGYREVGASGGFDVVFDEASLDVVGVHPAG